MISLDWIRRMTARRLILFLEKSATLLALLAVFLAATLASPAFLTPGNMANILNQIAITGVIAVGMTVVILTGGIDLSVGATVALVSVLVADVQGYGFLAALLAGLGAGLVVGLINGVGIVYARIQPFIMTLGMMAVVRGGAFLYSEGKPVAVEMEILDLIGWETFLGIPLPGLVFGALGLLMALTLAHTPWGRNVYAIGSNREAARLSGIRVRAHLISVYALSGLMAGVAGILFVARQGVGMALAGTGYELSAIASVVLGGASLFGGEGTVAGTFLGAGIIGVLGNGMNLAGLNPFAHDVVRGIMIVLAVSLRQALKRR